MKQLAGALFYLSIHNVYGKYGTQHLCFVQSSLQKFITNFIANETVFMKKEI